MYSIYIYIVKHNKQKKTQNTHTKRINKIKYLKIYKNSHLENNIHALNKDCFMCAK